MKTLCQALAFFTWATLSLSAFAAQTAHFDGTFDPAEAGAELRKTSDYKVYRITTDSLKNLGIDGDVKSINLQDAIVQAVPNEIDRGKLCVEPQIKEKVFPCAKDEMLVSFVRHTNSTNLIPTRGTCFCVSNNLLKDPTPTKRMSLVKLPNPEDINIFDKSYQDLASLTTMPKTVRGEAAKWDDSSVFVRRNYDHGAATAVRFSVSPKEVFEIPEEAEYSYRVTFDHDSQGKEVFKEVRKLWSESLSSPEWKDAKTQKSRNPYAIGSKDFEFQKEDLLNEYVNRTVDSLGDDSSGFAIFHNAWKLARITRDGNAITLATINQKMKDAITKRFNDPTITKKLMAKFEPFNKYMWEQMNAAAKASPNKDPSKDPSKDVDHQFSMAMDYAWGGEGGNPHPDLWNHLAGIQSAASEIPSEKLAQNHKPLSLADARKITEYKKLGAVLPDKKMCKRDFISEAFTHRNFPCQPKSKEVPCNLNLPGMQGDQIGDVKTFGKGKTYQLVDESHFNTEQLSGLKSTTFTARGTGYAYIDNGRSTSAGFAAIKRSGKSGKAHLGAGTLDSPITCALSKSAALNYGVCQGDMIYDETYGWLRVEDAAASYLDERVDVWRGTDVTPDELSADKILNATRKFVHFPAGLVDAAFAATHPGPKK